MQFRKFTALLLLSSTLAFGMAGAQETDVAPGASDTPAQGHQQNRDQTRKRRENMTEEEKQANRERWESMSDEEKQAMRERRQARSAEKRAKMRERWESMSDEERQAARERMKNRQGGKGGRHGRPDGHEGSGSPGESGGQET